MGLRYVEMLQLEKLFAEYGCPYTNILDELTQVSPEDIVKGMSLVDLKIAMDSRDDVMATQVWSREDIHAAIRAVRMQPDKKAVYGHTVPEDTEFVNRVAERARYGLSDCSDNWERIHAAVRECMSEEEKK